MLYMFYQFKGTLRLFKKVQKILKNIFLNTDPDKHVFSGKDPYGFLVASIHHYL